VGKRALPRKLSGVYEHEVRKATSPLFRGFDERFMAPHSRYTEAIPEEILENSALEVMASSARAGIFAVKSTDSRRFFIMGHPEYDADTLAEEYRRDLAAGLNPEVPENYFEANDPARAPRVSWRAAAQLLYSNWLNYYVYQSTPYDLEKIGGEEDIGLEEGAGI
jgi:homoserine O-succinyltransferase